MSLHLFETDYARGLRLAAHSHHGESFLNVVLEGSLVDRCGTRTLVAQKGDVVFHAAGEERVNTFDSDTRLFNVGLDPAWTAEAPHLDSRLLDHRLLALRIGRLRREWAAGGERLTTESFAADLIDLAPVATMASRSTPRWLLDARDLLHERSSSSLTLAALAGRVGVHPIHLHRTFRARYGCTIGAYVRRLRVEGACARLARGRAPLAEVALDAGFADQSHFTRMFKRIVGVTPAVYRAAFR
jgi:AraC family transcriptional regulator